MSPAALGQPLLAATVPCVDFVNAELDGTYQNEVMLPDDSGLVQNPHRVNPVNPAKQIVLQLGVP